MGQTVFEKGSRVMRSQINSSSSGLTFWRSWCERLWNNAESSWITRTGQDHYNRDEVILPALKGVLASEARFCGLVDIGCGDGYTTGALLDSLDNIHARPRDVLLLDLSKRQLGVALRRPSLAGAHAAIIDLETNPRSTQLSLPCHPTVFISVFVLQELPSLEPLLAMLADVLHPEDLGLCVTLAPSFSQRLADRGAITFETGHPKTALDWNWAGGFPVPVGGETVYLPHFQRDMKSIIDAYAAHGLTVTAVKDLCVPDSVEARRIFGGTVYGEDIIDQPSSVLLSVRKTL